MFEINIVFCFISTILYYFLLENKRINKIKRQQQTETREMPPIEP